MPDVMPEANESPKLETCQNPLCAKAWIESVLLARVVLRTVVFSSERKKSESVWVFNWFLINSPIFQGSVSRNGKLFCAWTCTASTHRPRACFISVPSSENRGTIAMTKREMKSNTTQNAINIAIIFGICHLCICHLLKWSTNGERRRETNSAPANRKIIDWSE